MIKTREQAEQALAELGQVYGQLEQLEGRHREVVARSEGRLAERRGILDEKAADLEAELETWTRDNLTGKRKTIRLVTGAVGLKKRPAKVERLRKAKTILDRLISRGLDHCVKTKQTIDGNALGNLTDEQLRDVGCRRVPGADVFFAKPKGETVTDA